MTRVCVVGSVNMDIGFDVDDLPGPGETALAASVRSTPGGKGANQAVAA
ncbi:PfkB family carbohydrate kinase, partial [Mycobacterium sp.]